MTNNKKETQKNYDYFFYFLRGLVGYTGRFISNAMQKLACRNYFQLIDFSEKDKYQHELLNIEDVLCKEPVLKLFQYLRTGLKTGDRRENLQISKAFD